MSDKKVRLTLTKRQLDLLYRTVDVEQSRMAEFPGEDNTIEEIEEYDELVSLIEIKRREAKK